MALLAPKYLNCVVAMGSQNFNDEPTWTATGFLYGNCIGEATPPEEGYSYELYLVTNRHVLKGKEKFIVRFNPKGKEKAKTFPGSLINQKGNPIWAAHPDEEIDLGVVRIVSKILKEQNIEFEYFSNNIQVLTTKVMLDKGIAEGDSIYILGFPMGLVGDHRNAVIARRGCIARIQDLLAQASKYFLVDAFVFPGNSGGPVILKPEMFGIGETKPSAESYLLGIVTAYLSYEEVAVSAQTGRPRIIFQENSGLAIVHPVDCIEETIQHWHSKQKAGEFE